MNDHLTDGELRLTLDGEAGADRLRHLEACADCRARMHRIEADALSVRRRLDFLASEVPAPPAGAAWRRFSDRLISSKENSMLKKWFAFPFVRFSTALVLILALILAFPATRALAGDLLNLFRVQQVTVIPVDFTGLEQLTGDGALGNRFSEMISQSVDMKQKPADPVAVTGAAQASEMAGFTVRLPQTAQPSQLYVTSGASFTLTVDRKKAQALLDEAGRRDLVLPESVDGARVSVEIPASVSAGFGTCPKPGTEGAGNHEQSVTVRRYPDCVIFAQIPSPSVNAPAGLDVEALARIGLEFTGMSAQEADAFTRSVDWTSTLVVPIPRNAATNRQVQVDGVTGTLIQRPADDAPQFALLWVKDGIIYAISGLGSNSQQAIDMANSLP